jgi:hypothetical protein
MLVAKFYNVGEFISEMEIAFARDEVAGPVRMTYQFTSVGGQFGSVGLVKVRAGFPTTYGLVDLEYTCGEDVPVTTGLNAARQKARETAEYIKTALSVVADQEVRSGRWMPTDIVTPA